MPKQLLLILFSAFFSCVNNDLRSLNITSEKLGDIKGARIASDTGSLILSYSTQTNSISLQDQMILVVFFSPKSNWAISWSADKHPGNGRVQNYVKLLDIKRGQPANIEHHTGEFATIVSFTNIHDNLYLCYRKKGQTQIKTLKLDE